MQIDSNKIFLFVMQNYKCVEKAAQKRRNLHKPSLPPGRRGPPPGSRKRACAFLGFGRTRWKEPAQLRYFYILYTEVFLPDYPRTVAVFHAFSALQISKFRDRSINLKHFCQRNNSCFILRMASTADELPTAIFVVRNIPYWFLFV